MTQTQKNFAYMVAAAVTAGLVLDWIRRQRSVQ